jgi:hypothetical protein
MKRRHRQIVYGVLAATFGGTLLVTINVTLLHEYVTIGDRWGLHWTGQPFPLSSQVVAILFVDLAVLVWIVAAIWTGMHKDPQ